MGLVYYKGKEYGEPNDELTFYAIEGNLKEIPEGGVELEKQLVSTENGKRIWKINIPVKNEIEAIPVEDIEALE